MLCGVWDEMIAIGNKYFLAHSQACRGVAIAVCG